MQAKLSFDELDLREEPARNTAMPGFNTTQCTTSDACTNTCGCTGTKYCN
jgi:hypothetical protein